MDIRKINDKISVAPQIAASDVAEAARLGFRTIVNNRPDGESWGQPKAQEIEAAVRQAGLNYIDMPVVSGQITPENVADFAAMLASAEGPVLAFCRTGTRCCNLWALAEAANLPADDIVRQAAAAGYDLRPLAPALEARGKRA